MDELVLESDIESSVNLRRTVEFQKCLGALLTDFYSWTECSSNRKCIEQ